MPDVRESAVYAAKLFISNMSSDNLFVKLDFPNAFNCLHRDDMLERVSEAVPELYKFCHLAYSQHSTLQFSNFSISSEEGSQQGIHLDGI